MSLHDTIIADATAVFCNANDFAESVTYRNGLTGSTQTVSVVVEREGMAEDSRGEMSELFRVSIPVSAVSSINPKTDELTFAKRPGETPTAQTIQSVLSVDEGMWVVECR